MAASTYNRSARNKISNNQGNQFEMQILRACKDYSKQGVAEICKVPEPFKVLKKESKSKFKGVFIDKAQPDFKGTLAGGRSIVFEAKYTDCKERRIQKSVVSEAQNDFMQKHYILGALVGVCVGIHNTYAFIPWSIWTSMKERYGRKYMTEDEIKEFEVTTFSGINFLLNYEKEIEKHE